MLRVLLPTFKPVLQQIRLLQVVCCCTDFWFETITRESRYTRELRHLLQNKFSLGPLNRATSTDLVAKSRTTLYFLQRFATAATGWFAARQVSLLGGKTRNIPFQLVLQKSYKTSCTFFAAHFTVPFT